MSTRPPDTSDFRAIDSPTRRRILVSVQIGTFLSILYTNIVNVAMPIINADFGVDVAVAKWIVTAYLFTLTVSFLSVGRLIDIFGSKRVLLFGHTVFALASLGCAIAPDLTMLVAIRVVQAAGAACLQVAALTAITQIYPSDERQGPLALNATINSVGQLVAPIIGGLLVQGFGWRSIFIAPIPIGLIALGLVWGMPALRAAHSGGIRSFDFRGAFLSVVGIGAVFLGFEQATDYGLQSPAAVALIVTGLVALVAFGFTQLHHAQPLLEVRLLRVPAFAVGAIALSLSFTAAAIYAFMMPYYLHFVLDFTPAQVGLALTPAAIGTILGAQLSNALGHKVNARTLAIGGGVLTAVAFLWLATPAAAAAYLTILPALLLFGLGRGVFTPSNQHLVLQAVPVEHAGAGSAFVVMMRPLGQLFGQSASAEIVSTRMEQHGDSTALHVDQSAAHESMVESTFLEAQSIAYLLATAISILVVALTMVSGRRRTVQIPAGQAPAGQAPAGASVRA